MRMIYTGKSMAAFVLSAMIAALFIPSAVQAQETLVTGRVTLAEGHESPTCRRVRLRPENGNDMWFRLPDTGADNSILAVALAALAGSRTVQIAYNPTFTSGCGTEPKILYISILGE